VHCGKKADWIWMRLGMGPGMRQVVRFGHRSKGGSNLGANIGRIIVTNGEVCSVAVKKCVNRQS